MLSLYGMYKMISRYVWMWFAMIIADSSMNMRRSRKGHAFYLYINNFNPAFEKFYFFLPSYNPFKRLVWKQIFSGIFRNAVQIDFFLVLNSKSL